MRWHWPQIPGLRSGAVPAVEDPPDPVDHPVAGFEWTGVLGKDFKHLINLCAMESRIQTTGADLYHRSCMPFVRYWSIRIAVALAKGMVYAVTNAGGPRRAASMPSTRTRSSSPPDVPQDRSCARVNSIWRAVLEPGDERSEEERRQGARRRASGGAEARGGP